MTWIIYLVFYLDDIDMLWFQNQREYSWSNNQPLLYTHWGEGEHSENVGGRCVAMATDGRWSDTTCASQLSFICKTTDGE